MTYALDYLFLVAVPNPNFGAVGFSEVFILPNELYKLGYSNFKRSEY